MRSDALEATVVINDSNAQSMTATVHADPTMAMTLIALGALLVVGLALFVVARILKKR